jgi:predicted ATP-grasp superfamily ATP-dependent carboligase
MGDRKPRGELAELQVSLQSLIEKGKRSDKEMRALKKDVFKKARVAAGGPPRRAPS